MKDIFQKIIDETSDEELKQKALDMRAAVHKHVDEILALGYPVESISCYTEEIPMDDPEEEMRGGLTIIFTCNGKEIPLDTTYEEFVKLNESNTEG
jgi:hypothetical protein